MVNHVFSQDVYPRNTSVDVKNYVFSLTLSDESNLIKGEAIITAEFKGEAKTFDLDLISLSEEFGMNVTGVFESDSSAEYTVSDNRIHIAPKTDGEAIRSFKIQYQGIPERGLIIDETKFGARSYFGDNWPNLARHWLPCVDHPYDKAAVEFRITAPEQYDVVATGKKTEESYLGDGMKLTTYIEPAPVAMKVMTICVTRFATQLLGTVEGIPVTAWVYPENRLDGFSDYAVAVEVLQYFIDQIGPYEWAKLANVQAKTQWGGLENAGCITYFENSVNGEGTVEGLIAHEIAHQWFGNSATENSWNHVWLSEGFATYFAILYQEHTHGDAMRKSELLLDRKQVINYYKKNPAPIVDNSIKDPLQVLSTNTYQKAGWVLNMLRHKIGDEAFWKGIRLYYKTYANSNVMTTDFRQIMESVSGENLKSFFQQWLFTEGHPVLDWKYSYKRGKLKLKIDQVQSHHIFHFPLEVGIVRNGKLSIETIQITEKSGTFYLETKGKPVKVILDPEMWLLFDQK